MFAETARGAAGGRPSQIRLLSYPEEEHRRAQLAAEGTPRMLLLAPGCPPPTLVDELEDWVRTPIDADELDARLNELARRSCRLAPRLEASLDDGILRVGDRWTSIPESQHAVVALLVERLDTVVSDHEIGLAYASNGLTPNPRTVKSMMWRLGRRLAEVGITLHKVRGRGYLVELARPGA